jgi:hopanoid biosynthesis associated protein HpnK
MLRLIVHADDFGLSEQVNEGIVQAHLNGIVTSASVIANGQAFEHAMRSWRSVPTLDLGIHLTLVEEQPLLAPASIPSLVDARGQLHSHATGFTRKYVLGKIRLREVRRELEAQVRKVLSHGMRVSHLDSHQHLHMLPRIWRMTIELAKEYGIPAIRVPHEPVRLYMLQSKRSRSRVLQLLVLNLFCRLGGNVRGVHTDHFAGFFFGGHLHKQNLQTLLQHLPPAGTCELMCHPGCCDPQTRYRHWGYHWSDELSALVDPEIADVLQRQGIQLISYGQLACL